MVHPVAITAAAAVSGLGPNLSAQHQALLSGGSALRPLAGFPEGMFEGFTTLPGAWIEDRRMFKGRRSGAAANLLRQVARQAVTEAGWSPADTRDAWLYAGTSRANQGEWRRPWRERRALKAYAASNSLHGEVAAAVSLDLGLRGPWQVLSNGCASGLDALGHGWLAIAAGLADRVLVGSVDLPLTPELLEDFRASGMLSRTGNRDPYSPKADGFLPGEAAVALCLERADLAGERTRANILTYRANSDAHDLIRLPEDGGPLAELLLAAWRDLDGSACAPRPALVCPHASGTQANAESECRALAHFAEVARIGALPVAVFKPHTGHTLGASGLLDVALLLPFLERGHAPPALPGLSQPPAPELRLATGGDALVDGQIWKVASGLGGHNALVVLKPFVDAP